MAVNITKNIEDITKQVLDINRKYLNKSIDVLGNLKKSGSADRVTKINQDLIAEFVNGVVKLNLEYYSKLVDYGFSVTKHILSGSEGNVENNEEAGSSFTLSGNGNPGSTIEISFVLDNTKEETVFCQLENTPFVSAEDQNENPEISVLFKPQSFELEAAKSVKISVPCTISKKSPTGTYYCYGRVAGFEPAYFTIVLTIEQNPERNVDKTEPAKKTAPKK